MKLKHTIDVVLLGHDTRTLLDSIRWPVQLQVASVILVEQLILDGNNKTWVRTTGRVQCEAITAE